MKTLLLLRHGKAVGSDPAGDHARALNERGRQQATEIGALLGRLGLEPELVLASDARRTRETAERALPGFGAGLRLEPRLYDATPDTILAVIRESAGTAKRILVVGHNPGIGALARSLEGSGDPQAVIGMQESFPTAGLAVLEFADQAWDEIGVGSGTLTRFIVPDASTPGV